MKRLRSLHEAGRAAPLVAAITFLTVSLAVSHTAAWAAALEGVWLLEGEAALQTFNCGGLMCGRIVWLQRPSDPHGQPRRDEKNPDPALRQRRLCGLTILWGLHPVSPDRWQGGGFYNPDDGETYSVSAELRSADVLVARIFRRLPLFGETKTMLRVPHGASAGWC
jgi:uncharacterized protein (DUF2147 family)